MEDKNPDPLIVGTWEIAASETDMGTVRSILIFEENKNFRMEVFFEASSEPIVSESQYVVEDEHLITDELNKGKPIPIKFESDGEKMILHMPNEEPTKLYRKSISRD